MEQSCIGLSGHTALARPASPSLHLTRSACVVSRELSLLEGPGAAAGPVVIDVPSPSAAEASRSPSPRAAAARRLAQLRRDEAAAEAGRGRPAVDLSDVV